MHKKTNTAKIGRDIPGMLAYLLVWDQLIKRDSRWIIILHLGYRPYQEAKWIVPFSYIMGAVFSALVLLCLSAGADEGMAVTAGCVALCAFIAVSGKNLVAISFEISGDGLRITESKK